MNCQADTCYVPHAIETFEWNAEQHPHRTAVRYRERAVSYRELDEKAHALALHLRHLGVTESSAVGVFLRPCVESLVAVLGVMKLRAIYVPLDVEHPPQRLQAIIADVAPAVILSKPSIAERLDLTNIPLLDIEAICAQAVAPVHRDFFSQSDPLAPAYIFYTSGTTGKPKGVVGTQQNLSHYLWSAITEFGMDSHTVMPAIARFTFSISLFELLCPLLAGGCVVILDRDLILNLPKLADVLETVTMFHMGPSLFKSLVAYLQGNYPSYDRFQHIRHVSLGGDIVPPALTQKLPAIFSNAEIFVIYGCSEIACMGCRYRISPDAPAGKSLVGAPFAQVELKLLDDALQPVAAGEAGEIYFSGPGVTSGYLNLQNLTAEKYREIDGGIFYRTGDIGRLDVNANLEILGRSDFQVKIRGIRIELGEIEAGLLAIAGVRDVIVTAATAASKSNESDDRALCAYVIAEQDTTLDAGHLKSTLKQRLPDYMIPAYFVFLDKFPLNHNMKLDRAALPAPDHSNLVATDAYVAATSALESELISLWQRMLRVDQIGINHSFFDLGGDSVLAASLIVELEQNYGREIPITTFFDAPTIAALARILADDEVAATPSDSFRFRDSSTGMLFLLHGAIVYRELAAAIDSPQGLCAVFAHEEAKLLGAQNTSQVYEMYADVAGLAARYLREIKRIQPAGPYFLAGFSMGGLVTMEVAKRLRHAGDRVETIFLFDCYVPDFFGRFYWDKIFSNIIKTLRGGIPHLQYMLRRLGTRIDERKSLTALQREDGGGQAFAAIENVRHQARRNASDDYIPECYDGDVVLFRATSRQQIGYVPKDPTLGWKNYLSRLMVYDVPGEHLDILKGASARRIAGLISSYLSLHTSSAATS